MTIARQKSGKVFYGWWVVLAAGVGLALHVGPIIAPTFGVFFKPLSQEFGWSRTEISLAFFLSTLVLGGAALVIGRLVDRFGARKVILPSVVLFGLGVLSLSFPLCLSLAFLCPLSGAGNRRQWNDSGSLLASHLPLV